MDALALLRRLWDHAVWADDRVLAALRAAHGEAAPHDAALREYAHVLGAEEAWLARLEGRPGRVGIWPTLSLDECAAVASAVREGYARYFAALTPASLDAPVHYANSAGTSFDTPVAEILAHVALHGQYHRGKVNVLLRGGGAEPAPADFIGFVRAAPAARTAVDAGDRTAASGVPPA